MTILIYLIKTILVSGLLFGYYALFLKNRTFHGFNRIFLLNVPLAGFLLPALHLGLPGFWNHSVAPSPIRLLSVGRGNLEEAVTIYAKQKSGIVLSWESMLILVAVLVSCFLLIRFVRSLWFLQRLRNKSPFRHLPEAEVYFVSEKGTPFSFFRSIFWGNEMDLNSPEGKQILRHELFHVKNHHSMDILLMEIFSILYWFNPFIHFIRRELQAIHEYAADNDAARETNGYQYAGLLLLKISGTPLSITNPFFKSQIKRRITMITKPNKNSKALAGRFMTLPVIFILICLFSFKIQNAFHSLSTKPIRVVIDAGHGGIFSGTQFNGVYEKNINLSIARKIQSLSGEYNVEVVMTRENDEDVAGSDLKASLNYRADLAKNRNADLFISIHANATPNAASQNMYSGFDIYVPDSANKQFGKSVELASSIESFIKPDYVISPELKQRKDRIMVLKKATVPAIIIECGYMDNASDLKYLLDEKSQEKIARDILGGIRKYTMLNYNYSKILNNSNDTIYPVDTVKLEDMNKIDIRKIDSISVDRKNKLIILVTGDGRKHVVIITSDMSHSWDSAHAAVTSHDTSADYPKVFTKVEVEADYPGGYQGWYNYLIKNLKYPKAAIKNEIQGEVMVEFIVKENGDLANIHAVSGPEELREASINIIKTSGKWIPAKQNGIVVDSYHTQPINYKLQ